VPVGGVDLPFHPGDAGEIDAVVVLQQAVIVYIGRPMRLPSRSFGVFTKRRFTAMKLCRNVRDGNTGSATNGHCPALKRDTYSELENSLTSNSWRAAIRSKISRGESMLMKSRSTPSTCTAPVFSASTRS
jgi:hypothetical protein